MLYDFNNHLDCYTHAVSTVVPFNLLQASVVALCNILDQNIYFIYKIQGSRSVFHTVTSKSHVNLVNICYQYDHQYFSTDIRIKSFISFLTNYIISQKKLKTTFKKINPHIATKLNCFTLWKSGTHKNPFKIFRAKILWNSEILKFK